MKIYKLCCGKLGCNSLNILLPRIVANNCRRNQLETHIMSHTLYDHILRFSRQTKESRRDRSVKRRVYFLTRSFTSSSPFFIHCFHSTALFTQDATSHRGSQPDVKQRFIRLTLHRGLLPQSGSLNASINSLARLLEPCRSCLYLLIPSSHLSIHPAPSPALFVADTQGGQRNPIPYTCYSSPFLLCFLCRHSIFRFF
jgi:hypothetical protein